MNPSEKQDNLIYTVFGLPFLVSDVEYLYFLVLREGVKHNVFPASSAISSEWEFLLRGFIPID